MSEDDLSRSDGELLAAIMGGDLAALGALYDRHAALAYGFALRLTGDPGRAAEVVQSAFMSLWNDRAEPHGLTDPVRLRLVQLVARGSMANLRRERPHRSPGLVDRRAGRGIGDEFPALPQGG